LKVEFGGNGRKTSTNEQNRSRIFNGDYCDDEDDGGDAGTMVMVFVRVRWQWWIVWRVMLFMVVVGNGGDGCRGGRGE